MMCNLSSDISDSQNKLLCFSITFCEWTLCRRTVFKKAITSDHRGFAGVRPRTTPSPPANIRSPELISLVQSVFR